MVKLFENLLQLWLQAILFALTFDAVETQGRGVHGSQSGRVGHETPRHLEGILKACG